MWADESVGLKAAWLVLMMEYMMGTMKAAVKARQRAEKMDI